LKKVKIVRILLESHSAYVQLGGHVSVLIWFFVLSLVEHVVLSVINFCGGLALDLSIDLVYFLALVPISSVVALLPISIGGIGVSEGLYVVLFSLAGLSGEQSLALALYMRALGLVALIPGAAIFLIDVVRLRRARQATRARN
jgi:uncharacterized membrane protein YbhN (UPF0104 family)